MPLSVRSGSLFPPKPSIPTRSPSTSLSPADIVEDMLNEDRKMLAAVQREKDRIAVGVDIITRGARGTAGVSSSSARARAARLGVLESAEMPPTFGTKPELVQAIMAGGKDAILDAA